MRMIHMFRMGCFMFAGVLGVFIASINGQQEHIAGSDVTITCPLQGSFTYPTWSGPPGSTQYIEEGHETSPTHPWMAYADNKKDLVISDAKPEHSGGYKCEKSGFGSSIVTLSVVAKPVVLLANKTATPSSFTFVRRNIITGFEDKKLTVSCSATGGRPEPHLRMLVNSTAIEDIDIPDERVETKKLEADKTITVTLSRTFKSTRKYDRTKITCKATNSNPSNKLGSYEVEDTSTLYFTLKPTVFSYTGGGSEKAGVSRDFSCIVERGRPPPAYTWSYDGQPITSDRFILNRMEYKAIQSDETVSTKQILTMKNITREDNMKKIMVTVSHEMFDRPRKREMNLHVQFGPSKVTISGNRAVYADGTATLTLTCSTDLTSVPNNHTIKWSNATLTKELWHKRRLNKTDMWISTPGEYNAVYVSENLTLEVDRYMDGQSILCETSPAENWHKTFDDSVVLDINYTPIIMDPFDTELRVAEDEEVTLLCSAWSKPPSTFTWYKEGSNVPLVVANGTMKRNAASYTIPRVSQTSHSGKYKCVASNREGHSVEKRINLIISDGPAVPSLGILDTGTDSVTIEYRSTELSPVQIETYHLQYRLAGDSSTTWHEVMLQRDGTEFKLSHVKPGTAVEMRIKVTNRDGSRYTNIVETRTQASPVYKQPKNKCLYEENITQKDVIIAIVVSVIVTTVIVLIIVGLIFYFYRRKQSFDPSRKFEMESTSPLRT